MKLRPLNTGGLMPRQTPPPPTPLHTPNPHHFPSEKELRKPQTFTLGSHNAGLPPAFDFMTAYDLYYAENRPKLSEGEREKGVLSPSHGLSMEYACDRQCVLALLRAVPDPPTPWQRKSGYELNMDKTADNGTIRHEFLQKMFTDMTKARWMGFEEIHIEPTLRHPTLRLKGSADAIVKRAGWWYVLDIKTIGKAKAADMLKPDARYALQLNTYMGLSGVKAAYIVNEIRDNLAWLQPSEAFRVNFDGAVWASTLKLAEHTTDHAKRRTLPQFDEQRCNRHKTFCKFTAVCGRELDGENWLAGSAGIKEW